MKGAKDPGFDDSSWRRLDLPYDWSIEGKIDFKNPTGWRGGFFPAGVGWYRKVIPWEKGCEGRKVRIEFDGVFMLSDVWINGIHLGRRPYGYIGFSYDLTPYLEKGKNVVAVRVDDSKVPNTRWYPGCGIYRHVWLTVTEPVHLVVSDLFIYTKRLSENEALLEIRSGVRNETKKPSRLKIEHSILDPRGRAICVAEKDIEVEESANVETLIRMLLKDPMPWSPSSPSLYTLKTSLLQGKRVVDQVSTSFGIRTISIDPRKGFFLNGKNVKLKGVCLHHDGGPVGSAVPEDVWHRRLVLLKRMGCNAVRTAHNPQAPEFYDICDELGIMVMDEAFDGWDKPKAKYDYGLYFKEWWRKDLEAFIKRDRNHPSVVIWSIGNEVPGYTLEMQKKLYDLVKSLDPTRPITQGRGERPGVLDIIGFNGRGEYKNVIERFHEKHPDQCIIGTEMTHTLQTRGVYRTRTWFMARDFPAPWVAKRRKKIPRRVFPLPDLTKEEVFKGIDDAYQSSYDNAVIRMSVRREWSRTKKFPFFMGSFRWTGIDYLGEAISKRARASNFGVIDLAGFPKDHYYLYQSLWTRKPMVHILPHWTHPGLEGKVIPVVIYTNCESAELFLNGKSLGKKTMGPEFQILWKVPYEPGALEVFARTNGKTVARDKKVTAGKPAGLALQVPKKVLKARSRQTVRLEVRVVDAKGNPNPIASNMVYFHGTGPAKLIAVENGDILDLSPTKADHRKAFMGKCMGLIQAGETPGRIEIKVTSPGLRPASVTIEQIRN